MNRWLACVCLICLGLVLFPSKSPAPLVYHSGQGWSYENPSGNGDNVVATWHFAGVAHLADDSNFDNLKRLFALQSSTEFRDLVLDRFSGWLANSLEFVTHANMATDARPFVNDLLSAESVGALGGAPQGPLHFVLAVKLDAARSQAWQDNLRLAYASPGENYQEPDGSGWRWKTTGGQTIWMLRSGDWTLVGCGADLASVQTQFLQELKQHGSPAPALAPNWLEADVDWAHLGHWLPEPPFPLKPARTALTFTAFGGNLSMKAKVTYPEPIPWKAEEWNVPTNLIRDPLISFTAGQDISAFLSADEPLSQLTDNPLDGEFYVWALGQMGFQSYATWPVANATNALQQMALQVPAAFNPDLAKRHAGSLSWEPNRSTLVWGNLSPILAPFLEAAPKSNGRYLLAALFPLSLRDKPAPDELFNQVRGRTNLVYYDWELTGPRLDQWRLLSGILPVLPELKLSPAPVASANAGAPPVKRTRKPILIEENWLSGVTPFLDNTVTEITRTGPNELAVVRKSPFAVTALELVIISHWMSGTGSPGINPSLLPPPAKVTGPGIPGPKPKTP